jgi:putative peptide zinc metalloprotease protein
MITKNSVIEFHRLKFSRNVDEHNLLGVVRWDTDDSLKIDKDVLALIKFLQQGRTVKEVSEVVKFSPDVLISILHMLEQNNFIKTIDNEHVRDDGEKIKPWLMNVDRKWFEWIITKPVIISILVIMFSGILLGFIITGVPTYKSYFWTSDLFVVFFSLEIVTLVLVFLHELSHFVVTKAVGGEAIVRLSYRYLFVVAETESYHLGVLPKQRKYLVYAAGMIFDCFFVALLYWFIIITKVVHMNNTVLDSFIFAVILCEVTGVIWQFDIFLETDMYNFLTEYLNIEFIRNDALKYIEQNSEKWKIILFFPIKKYLNFFMKDYAKNSDDLRLFSYNDRKKIKVFIILLIGGLISSTFIYGFYSIPRDITYVFQSINDIVQQYHRMNIIGIVKSLTILAMIAFDYSLIFILWFKHKKKARIKR